MQLSINNSLNKATLVFQCRSRLLCNRVAVSSILSRREIAMFHQEELCERIHRLQEKRDNIIYALVYEELTIANTLQLETQLSAVEDELVLQCTREAA